MSIHRGLLSAALALLLQACGGGGSGDNGGGNNGGGDPDPRLTVGDTTLSVSASPGDLAPQSSFSLTITDVPDEGLTLRAGFSDSGIESIGFMQVDESSGQINVQFRNPGSLVNAVYNDQILVQVCPDEDCLSEIDGSPVTVTTDYSVSGEGPTTVSFDRDALQFTIEALDSRIHSDQFHATLDVVPEAGTFWFFENSSHAILDVEMSRPSTSEAVFTVAVTPTEQLGPGIYDDTVDIRVCYDLSCVRQVRGSPFTLTSNVIAGIGPEPGYEQLVVESRTALPHDILDAAFSQSLRQVVTISGAPANALYTYDVATGTERQQLLAHAPADLSLAPDGLTAAVAHDGHITIVDLAALSQPSPPAPVLLDVSIDVVDVVLDGAGHVHAFERFNTWGSIHSVEIATNTESTSVGPQISSGSRARLHPSGDFLYTVPSSYDSGEIGKWDITPGHAEWLRDSDFLGAYGTCGDLWMRENGSQFYTTCGHVFAASDVAAEDMVYTGSLRVSDPSGQDFEISSVSHSAALNEVAMVEYDPYYCAEGHDLAPCYSHLGLFNPNTLKRRIVYSVPPVTVDDVAYRQMGLFVFHDAGSEKKILLSRLRDMEDPAREYYLSFVF